jgi:putative redox protein
MTTVHLATAHLASGTAPYEQRIRVRGHEIVSDEPVASGGADAGASPYGLLAASLAACTSMTLRMYADRKGWPIGHVEVEVTIQRDGDAETIARTIKLAPELTAEQRTRLGEIAEKTPVTKTIRRGTPITTTIV